ALKSVLARQDSSPYLTKTELSYSNRVDLSYPDAKTKETKKNLKESLKESPTAHWPFDGATVRASEEEKDERESRKKLSAQRNKMAVSKLYSDEELAALRDKSLSELESIHAGRVLGKASAVTFTEGLRHEGARVRQ